MTVQHNEHICLQSRHETVRLVRSHSYACLVRMPQPVTVLHKGTIWPCSAKASYDRNEDKLRCGDAQPLAVELPGSSRAMGAGPRAVQH